MASPRNIRTTICVIFIGVLCLQGQINLSEGLSYRESVEYPQDVSVVSLGQGRFRRQVDNSSMTTPMTTTAPEKTTTPDFLDYNIAHDDHSYYKSLTIKQSNIADYWVELKDAKGHQTLSDSHRTAVTASLPFMFLFYGHPVTNVTIATGGFLYMSPFIHKFLTATQYVAPLMANFDTITGGENSSVIFKQVANKFVVEWRDVYLQDQNGSGTFQFQVILHMNGSIVFVYKQLPLRVYNISDVNHSVKVGLSDAFYYDTLYVDEKGISKKRRTIYEYHRVLLNTSDIREGTVVILHPLPTCNQYSECESCVNSKIGFTCKWCGVINRCSDSVDWYRQEWLDQGCVHLSGSANCSQIPTRAPQAQTSSTSTVKDIYLTSMTTEPAADYNSQQKADVQSASQSTVAIIVIVIVFVLVLIGGVGGWMYYAYTHPTTASGMWLMEHRPSQMKAKLANMKFWKRDSAGDKYAVDSTA
ncbi:plexin domain-containing protein 1-like isoform X38 [Dreissena polymorpha]|uniref:plexin domain-containing protein 1-like isoform X34 n=1 Tax=Dreissena polymorpha TaxID=45954 RepID=UPI00226560D7|nr:plexin domain-containing protein 1-like isoform X34 [Dreissena polymorpha]XP_052257568.1 plexin domain-containing protein 1-like isoform X35 [Dreissena polymorpha]XP_052257569.1 plexin domain-containing protein 1-like isoform X36 [Dreissena polymorpha]XP_052257570.1 plexin domain-containing protein 1-like isoform X37 [Dreissena polymorpha]XP_052257571.1 plexin domain-containing protein 1-like isoform X38 [Dreissena polymorpha]